MGALSTPCVPLVRLVVFVTIQHDHHGKITEVVICLKGADLTIYKVHDHLKVCLRVADTETTDASGDVVSFESSHFVVHVSSIEVDGVGWGHRPLR